jgi:spore germination protein GerM
MGFSGPETGQFRTLIPRKKKLRSYTSLSKAEGVVRVNTWCRKG